MRPKFDKLAKICKSYLEPNKRGFVNEKIKNFIGFWGILANFMIFSSGLTFRAGQL